MTALSAPVEARRSAPIALTMGEPAGIGGEIALKAWLKRSPATPVFFCIDDPARLASLARGLGLAAPIAAIGRPEEAPRRFAHALPVLPEALAAPTTPGRPDPANAPAVIRSIDRALALVRQGSAAAMVTNPIHKKTLYDSGFRHPGHTEYLAASLGVERPVMMLVGGGLRVVPVTVHASLRQAIAALIADDIVACGRIAADALARDFGCAAPRLAVAALNPHGGEDGAFGSEERTIIAPAAERLRRAGIAVEGPLPADTLFHEGARARYDAVLCMYHDQALIPLKTLAFDCGVNVTLGLPIVRTSPDHGTAFDIAGSGRASEASLVAAIDLAAALAHRRAARAAEAVA